MACNVTGDVLRGSIPLTGTRYHPIPYEPSQGITEWNIMARKMKVESVEFSRTGKRSKTAKLETMARKQVRRIKYVESMPSYLNSPNRGIS